MRARASSRTSGLPRRARDTVAWETPARWAMSIDVASALLTAAKTSGTAGARNITIGRRSVPVRHAYVFSRTPTAATARLAPQSSLGPSGEERMSTRETPVDLAHEQRATARIVLIAAAAALGGFLFGFDTAVINGAAEAIRGGVGLNAARIGIAVSCALLGAAAGAWYAGPLADRLGRVRAMQVAALLLAISAIGSGLASSMWPLILWRVIGGTGVG